MSAARTILAMALLLMLLAGNIVWSAAAASGPMCTLTCCASRAAHAAGSCMNGSCQAGVLKLDPANTNLHSHHHHDQPQPRESGEQNSELRSKKSEVSMPGLNVPQAFVGAVAVAHGSDNDQPQTIDATSDATVYEHAADNPALSSDGNGDGKFALSAIALTKPCSAECGAGAAGFISSKRSRHASTLAVRNRAQPLITSVLPNYEPNLTCPRATFGRTTTPRGPPQLPFC